MDHLIRAVDHLVILGLTIVNLGFALICLKCYTEYTKDKLQRRRRQAGTTEG